MAQMYEISSITSFVLELAHKRTQEQLSSEADIDLYTKQLKIEIEKVLSETKKLSLVRWESSLKYMPSCLLPPK